MDGIERIHELLDELAEVTKKTFPDYTRISANCTMDGYRTFTVLKWGTGEYTKTATRKVLFDQTKIRDKWGDDSSQEQNEYYKKLGILLKD